MDTISENILFGVVLSLAAFEIGLFINRKTKIAVFNPLLIAIAIVIGVLVLFKINFNTYNNGGKFIDMFLGPSTVVLAVPLYKQIDLLKKNSKAILVGVFLGSLIGMCSIIGVSYILGLDPAVIKSLIPKSVTTPIGMSISSQIGGITSVTVLAIIITGIIGSISGPIVCKIFKIEDSIAVGVSIGTSSHAVGTTKALELGEIEGAMSSLCIGVAGMMTVVLAPLILNLYTIICNMIK